MVSSHFSENLPNFDKKCTKSVFFETRIFVSLADKNQFYSIPHSTDSEMSKYSRVASISHFIAENELIVKSTKIRFFHNRFSSTLQV